MDDAAPQEFGALKELQPFQPLMATEFWSGWYDPSFLITLIHKNVKIV